MGKIISTVSNLGLGAGGFGLGGALARYRKDLSRFQRLLDPIVVMLLYWDLNVRPPSLGPTSVLLVGLVAAILLNQGRIYEGYRQASLWTLFRRLTTSWLLVLGALLLWGFVAKVSAEFSREAVFSWALSSWLCLCLMHVGGRKLLRYKRIWGGNSRSVLYLGPRHSAISFYSSLQKNAYLGLRLAAWLSPDSCPGDVLPPGMPPSSGNLEDLSQWLQDNGVDSVVFTDSRSPNTSTSELVQILGDSCLPIFYVPSWADSGIGFQEVLLGSQPCLQLWPTRDSLLDRQLKRSFDLVVSGVALTFLSPLLLIIALAIRITSPGPVLFLQDRYGLDGKPFRIFKFRSMRCLEAGDQPGLRQATRNDSRVTPVGAFLRRWSLDELPQLFNVLLGQMSIVGPRPHAVEHNELYRKQIRGYMKRHVFKPGITGLAQVRGFRGETPTLDLMQKRVQADLEYQRRWSLATDFKILIKTLFHLSSPSAY